jgi:hypothetical protein
VLQKLHLEVISAQRVRREVRVVCQPLPSVGIGTPNIRVDRFPRFAVRLAFGFLRLSLFGHLIAPDVIQPSSDYSQQAKGTSASPFKI